MKILAITQARYGSGRLPGKVLKPINNTTLLEMHLQRVLKSKAIGKLIVATTFEKESDGLIEICIKNKVDFFQGDTNNVLERFYYAAAKHKPDLIVRLTSDCPLIDPILIDEIVNYFVNNGIDYCSNTLQPTYPDGMDLEVFTFNALKIALEQATLPSEREHVTPYIWKNSTFFKLDKFKSFNYSYPKDYSKVRLTVDTSDDLQTIKYITDRLGMDLSWKEYADFYLQNIDRMDNFKQSRNEGYLKSLKNDIP